MLGPRRREATGRVPVHSRIHLPVWSRVPKGWDLRLPDHAGVGYGVLPDLSRHLGQDVEKDLEAHRIRRRHDQEDASPILWAHGSIQVGVFANELGRDPWPHACGGPARPRAVHPTKTCFIGEHDPQTTTTLCGDSPGSPYGFRKAFFLKSICASISWSG